MLEEFQYKEKTCVDKKYKNIINTKHDNTIIIDSEVTSSCLTRTLPSVTIKTMYLVIVINGQETILKPHSINKAIIMSNQSPLL